MDDTLELLHAPLGMPGSGRVRYGAAMELFRRGLLSEAQLDVYRDAAPHDARDPAAQLAALGLPPVPPPMPVAHAAFRRLLDSATAYLNGLSHAGGADVRAGLARSAFAMVPAFGTSHPVVDRWLQPALQEVSGREPRLASAIAAAAPFLSWVGYDAYPRAEIGESFAQGHAFARIIGSGAPYAAADFEMGLFLIAPHVLYRDHCHPAPELYAPLTGPHGWRFGPGRPLVVKPAGEPIWNPPLRPHLTKVGSTPFLSLFAWTRDVAMPAQVIAAGDWTELEALTLPG